MRYKIVDIAGSSVLPSRSVLLNDQGRPEFTSFLAQVGNPNYDSFLESQGLSDAEVQAMEPDVWHDMAATVI